MQPALKKFRNHDPKPAPYSSNPVRCAKCGQPVQWDDYDGPDGWGQTWRHYDNYLAVQRLRAERGVVMDQVIVTLEGKDHKIGQGEHTMCGIPVPHGTPHEEGAKRCSTCFPKDEVEPEPEPVFSIAVEPETLGQGLLEAPEKPTKKATKEDATA